MDVTCARLGADVDRYTFIVVDLHHLLLAGLPAHVFPRFSNLNFPLAWRSHGIFDDGPSGGRTALTHFWSLAADRIVLVEPEMVIGQNAGCSSTSALT